ncbi:hypothetical protein Acor_78940 [Acrocarpospora corrugata]|uniref:F5/8 type C domain-containing protein n=1 Tax=Acrocarpospora corrugata TaxID=35763 RepID=A0A5M3W9T1_9ACTN|nr:hypothetical protein [Acrocarpospora corrugata]GES05825.1 hypothetical protein Acor_78940 [Acrocarpospora corrugata]
MKRWWIAILPTLVFGLLCSTGELAVAAAAPGDGNVAGSATASASYTSPWERVTAINDGVDPPNSNGTVNPRWGTWPNTGQQWALLTWPSAQTLNSADVYFFDDNGGVRLPASWKLQTWNGSAYVDIPGTYPRALNQYNRVSFPAISTTRLRVLLQSGTNSVGLLEVKAYAPTSGGTGWSPPANLVTPLNQVWQHYESTYPQLNTFRNYGWDQVMANGGSINYCVRWESTRRSPPRCGIRSTLRWPGSSRSGWTSWLGTTAGRTRMCRWRWSAGRSGTERRCSGRTISSMSTSTSGRARRSVRSRAAGSLIRTASIRIVRAGWRGTMTCRSG